MEIILDNISTILSYIFTISISILITWFFSKKFQSKKRITCQYKNISVFEYKEELAQDLEISYNNNKIQHLYKFSLALWNNGTKEIRKEDFINSDLLKIQLSQDTLILDVSIIKISDNDCNFNYYISDDRRTLYIYFEYLNPKDGLALNILHSDNSIPRISGNFIGLSEKINVQDITSRKSRLFQAIMILAAGLIVITTMIFSCFVQMNDNWVLLKGVFIITIIIILFRLLVPPKKKVPRKLECDELSKY